MLFKKPNIKYTDMCIYVDSIVNREEPPTEQELNKCFEYIYHIGFMLAHKHKYFNKSYYYEEFAIFLATEVMYRLFFNPKLKETSEDGEPSLTKIKSVLNYIKSILYARKVMFEQQAYSQQILKNSEESNFSYAYNEDLYQSLKETDVSLYFNSISKTVKHIVYNKNFYKNDKILMKNIYVSCLLTVLNGITFTEYDILKLNNTYSSIESKYRLLGRLYSKNRDNALVLYHLDKNYSDYIRVLVNKVYKQIKDELSSLSSQSFALSDDIISNILFLEINGEDYNE